MKSPAYNFEIKNLIRMFTTALDGCIINRYHDKGQVIADKIKVQYRYAPKQKVVDDLVNKGANVKLPVVAITMTGIQRDVNRVFYKTDPIDTPETASVPDESLYSATFNMPIPVKVSINVSILTKYQSDMDQILQNFMVNSNPYFVISWTFPNYITNLPTEIRSKVYWNESIDIKTPVDISADQKSHIEANTSFTIDGWLFDSRSNPDGTIYYITANFRDLNDTDSFYDSMVIHGLDSVSATNTVGWNITLSASN